MAKKTRYELMPEGYQSSYSYSSCNYLKCQEKARYLATFDVAPSGNRGAFSVTKLVCEKHGPKPPVRDRSEPPEPGMISTQEAADVIGIPVMTLHQWRHRGHGPSSVKVQGYCWYKRSEVEAFVLQSRSPEWEALVRADERAKVAEEVYEADYAHRPLWADDEELAEGRFTDRDLAWWMNALGHPQAHAGCCAICGCATTCTAGMFFDAVTATAARVARGEA